jgi:DNA-binding XRE family transcriptional regulator
MNLQIVNSLQGQPEYVLLPINVYYSLSSEIEKKLQIKDSDYIPFVLENYVKNPVALARIKSTATQEELASAMGVTQAYVSKIERQKKVTAKVLEKVGQALKKITLTS